jgi:hypothetical protein
VKKNVGRLIAGAAFLGGWFAAFRVGLKALGEAAFQAIFAFLGMVA